VLGPLFRPAVTDRRSSILIANLQRMTTGDPKDRAVPEITAHYAEGREATRLSHGRGQLELARTQELLRRHLPDPPATILDVGGGAGVYACWLAAQGYEAHLIDLMPLHLEQARLASDQQAAAPLASVRLGDARRLDQPDESADAVLLLGPLYHLTERRDRVLALAEAKRVVRPGGLVLAVGISRFASLLDGLHRGFLDDPSFVSLVERDLKDGQHRNPTNHPGYFTTAFLHHPDELQAEAREASLAVEEVAAIEGPADLVDDFERWWSDPQRRERLLWAIRAVEHEPSLLGVSSHIMVVARKT
jgi:ubiquinone/menaquinone biosynthesis C-methylase UbiE